MQKRKFEPKRRSLADPAMNANVAAHEFDQLLCYRGTKPAATKATGCRLIGLHESLENSW